MAIALGNHAQRLGGVRALRSVKGRREQRRFAFEGPTLLSEARANGIPIEELYVTQAAYDAADTVRQLEAAGVPTFLVSEASAARISDLTQPSGIVAVAPIRLEPLETIAARAGPLLVLADLNDPANAGTLLRSADAFGAPGAVFGERGVDPYHPKVVRGSMGAVFRLALAVADPAEVANAAAATGRRVLGLAAGGTPIGPALRPRLVLVVGHERRGLDRWEAVCERLVAIPMMGRSESLSAAVAGSIALYEATRATSCQESDLRPKSQDYRC
jgi:TrmH family RNA methyltransferase